jgi:membrane-bound metal-dependent hydrolase YbcI (DUF457 family)
MQSLEIRVFVGHFAVAFGAKPLVPRVSLGVLFLAAQLADLIWPNLVLAGIEVVRVVPGATALTPLDFVHYPWSHSLLALAVWGLLLGLLYAWLRRAGRTTVIVLFALVLSHWLLDVLTHRPDMPVLLGDSVRIGLGLWNHPVAAVAVELALFAVGVVLYVRHTKAVDRTGSVAMWALVAFLFAVHLANSFGPPPPSATAVAWAAQSMWLLVLWGYWVDAHRVSV